MENKTLKGELYSKVPEFCFTSKCARVHKAVYADKPIYVFENHAAALKAWWELSQGCHLNVLTFDEHTDTHPPMWGYCVHVLNYNEQELIKLLDDLKSNLSDAVIDSLYGKLEEYSNAYFERRLLQHDEHIATAIYWEIIHKAYVCSPSSSNPKMLISNDILKHLYENVVLLESPFARMNYPFEFSNCSFFYDFVELQRKVSVNLDNDTIDKVMNQLPLDSDFILDEKYYSLSSFCKLIKRAKGITIATEIDCVREQVKNYSSIISKIDNNCKLIGCVNPFRKEWDSRMLLKYLLGLIEYVLSGQWEKECEIDRLMEEEWKKMGANRDESSLPLIPCLS